MSIPFRQIHLDFHTSEHIPEVGQAFDAEDFAGTFKRAHVDSVTLFARCHHGWTYFDSEVGQRHPSLEFDLLRAQFDALKAAGIRAPIYITGAWDELSCREHPEWRVVTEDGKFLFAGGNTGERNVVRWGLLDFSTPAMDFLEAMIREVAAKFPDADGIFVDICHQYPSCSPSALAQMERMGLDWTREADRLAHAAHVKAEFMRRTTEAAKSTRADMPVFHNHGNLTLGDRAILDFDSHLEIESLPTGGWGYDHFPIGAKYAESIGADYSGMTGKFHTLWGEFGAYKHPDALRYECGFMLAHGAKCSIGDHLHPSGRQAQTTYNVIAPAYAEVAAKEPWCEASRNVADIAMLSVRAVNSPDLHSWDPAAVNNAAEEGCSRVLLEERLLFDVIDTQADLAPYRLVIVPDEARLPADMVARLQDYVEAGGALLLTGTSGIGADGQPQFDFGGRVEGPSPFASDYAVFDPAIAPDFVEDPVFLYEPSQRLSLTDGESLGLVHDPYFDRTQKHFNGHMNTPYDLAPSGYHAVLRKGRICQAAHPLFSIHFRNGPAVLREVLGRLVREMLGAAPRAEADIPIGGRLTLREQADPGRLVLHLLYATPQLRGQFKGSPIEIIQDLPKLRDVPVRLRETRPVARVTAVPTGVALDFTQEGGLIRFDVPEIVGHQMISLEFAG